MIPDEGVRCVGSRIARVVEAVEGGTVDERWHPHRTPRHFHAGVHLVGVADLHRYEEQVREEVQPSSQKVYARRRR